MTDEQAQERKRRGFWLREARDRKGLKQPDVAQRLGYSPKSGSTVNKWETGERDVPTRHLAKLARLYGVPPNVFIYPEPTAEERLNELARDAIGLALDDLAGRGKKTPTLTLRPLSGVVDCGSELSLNGLDNKGISDRGHGSRPPSRRSFQSPVRLAPLDSQRVNISTVRAICMALLVVACAGPAATPQIIYVTPAPTVAATPTAAPTAEPTHDIAISMKLYGVQDLDIDYDTDECRGDGGYSDIKEGMQFDILDTHGELVAFASMNVGHVGDARVSCDFSGRAEDVPDMPVYVFQMGTRGTVNFTQQKLAANGWLAEFSIGD